MKFAAHPLVVAVALGLLAPDALEAQDVEQDTVSDPVIGRAVPVTSSAPLASSATWAPSEAPSAEDLHRVEIAWLKATGQPS